MGVDDEGAGSAAAADDAGELEGGEARVEIDDEVRGAAEQRDRLLAEVQRLELSLGRDDPK